MASILSATNATNELSKFNKQYLIFLHSWMTGKSAFIFGINETSIIIFDAATVDPTVKEKWNLSDIKEIKPNVNNEDEFTIEMNNNNSSWSVRKSTKWTLSCSMRSRLLADVLKFRKEASGDVENDDINFNSELVDILKQRVKLNIKLKIGSIEGKNKNDANISYFNIPFENIKYVSVVQDLENALAITDSSGSTYIIEAFTRRDEMINEMENRMKLVGLKLLKDQGHVKSISIESLLIKSGFLITSNVGSTNINTDDYLNVYDWSRSGPRIGKHLPLATFPATRVKRFYSATTGSNRNNTNNSGSNPSSGSSSLSPSKRLSPVQQMQGNCSLVLMDDYLGDIDLEKHLLVNWFKISRIYAIVCSSMSNSRFTILYEDTFVEYDCMNRDDVLSGMIHHLENNSLRIYLGDIHMCRMLLNARVVALNDTNLNNSTMKYKNSEVFYAHRAAAEGVFIRKIASIVALQARSDRDDLGAMHYVLVDMARLLASNCEASGVTSFEDRNALCNCMSVLAQQINSTSFVDGAKDVVFLMHAFELLLSAINGFESFLDIPNVVVMINRFFRILSAAGQSKSNTISSSYNNGCIDNGPSRSLLIYHILQLLKRMVIFDDASLSLMLPGTTIAGEDSDFVKHSNSNTNNMNNNDNNNNSNKKERRRSSSTNKNKIERINYAEKHRREELMSFQRIRICIQLLSNSCNKSNNNNNDGNVENENESTLSKNNNASILIVHNVLDLFSSLICEISPRNTNTPSRSRETILKLLADHSILMGLFSFDAPSINDLAALIMREIVISSKNNKNFRPPPPRQITTNSTNQLIYADHDTNIDFVSKLRYDVLCDGTALSHFHSALFGRNERIRKQSRFMFSLWMDDFQEGLSILSNILPDVFYNILTEVTNGRSSSPLPGEGMATDLAPKWERFFLALQHDHYHAKLVWNESCRKELRIRLENEIKSLEQGRATSIHISTKSTIAKSDITKPASTGKKNANDLNNSLLATTVREKRKIDYVTWNYKEFKIKYKAHEEAVKIGHYFLAPMLSLRHSARDFPIEKLETPYLFHMVHNGILKEIVKNIHTNYVKNKTLGTLLSILEVLVSFHHDALAATRVGEALNTLGDLLSSLSEFIEVNAAENHGFYLHENSDVDDDMEDDLNNSSSGSGGSSDYLFSIISKTLSAIQILGKYFPYEIDNFVDANGLNACIRILRVVPSAKAGSPESMMASRSLETLRGLCASHSVFNPKNNASVWPLPTVRTMLCSKALLPIIASCLLARDEKIVGQAATLIAIIIENNASVIGKLYLTGIFYFALIYDGNATRTVEAISCLLKMTHEHQVFPLKNNLRRNGQKSYLSFILPDALVCFLSTHSYQEFATILVGDYDTPEAIWSPEMRQYMVSQLKEHVRDYYKSILSFSTKQVNNNKSNFMTGYNENADKISNKAFFYHYDPIPPIHYPQLSEEMYCCGYYLRNLCNFEKFPSWKIHDPVELLRAVLDAWRTEKTKAQGDDTMSFTEASLILGLDISTKAKVAALDKKILRKTYFKLARLYHPDRNPSVGKEKFEKINEAYERMILFIDGRVSKADVSAVDKYLNTHQDEHVDIINLSLLLKAQIVLYSNSPEILEKFKYPMYDSLMHIVEQESEFVTNLSGLAVRLMACTAATHAGNAKELMRWGGFDVIIRALRTAIGDDSRKSLYEGCMIALSAFSLTDVGRKAVASSYLAVAAIHESLTSSKEFPVLQASFRAGRNFAFHGTKGERSTFLEKGLFFSMLSWSLGKEISKEGFNVQFVKSAVETLFALSGYRAAGQVGAVWDSEHEYARKALEHLVTRPLVNQCANLLGAEEGSTSIENCMLLLHSEAFTPRLIWNREMRGKVVDYVDNRANELAVSNFLNDDSDDSDDDEEEKKNIDIFNKELNSVKGFSHDILRNQVLVGDVYLRPFVEQEERLTGINIEKFTKDLLEYLFITKNVLNVLGYQSLHLLLDEMSTYKFCVEQIVSQYISVLYAMIGHMRKYSISAYHHNNGSRNNNNNNNNNNNMSNDMQQQQDVYEFTLELILLLLDLLSRNASISILMVDAGIIVDLLHITVVNVFSLKARITCASILAHILEKRVDRVQNTKVSLERILPMPLLKLVCDKTMSGRVPNEFDKLHDTPELQWDGTCREELRMALEHLKSEVAKDGELQGITSMKWKLPGEDEFQLNYSLHYGKFVVYGVFVKRFLQDPGSTMTVSLSDPIGFARALSETMKKTMLDSSQMKSFVLSCQAFVVLLKNYPYVIDEIATLGIISDFLKLLGTFAGNNDNLIFIECFLRNAMVMCTSHVAVEQAAISSGLQAVLLLLHSTLPASSKTLGNASPNSRIASQCLALIERMITIGNDIELLMRQIVNSEFIEILINYLEWESTGAYQKQYHLTNDADDEIDYGTHLRVFSVSILKRLSRNHRTSMKTNKILEKHNKIWSRYKDQDESLYLSRENVVELLEGGSQMMYLME